MQRGGEGKTQQTRRETQSPLPISPWSTVTRRLVCESSPRWPLLLFFRRSGCEELGVNLFCVMRHFYYTTTTITCVSAYRREEEGRSWLPGVNQCLGDWVLWDANTGKIMCTYEGCVISHIEWLILSVTPRTNWKRLLLASVLSSGFFFRISQQAS